VAAARKLKAIALAAIALGVLAGCGDFAPDVNPDATPLWDALRNPGGYSDYQPNTISEVIEISDLIAYGHVSEVEVRELGPTPTGTTSGDVETGPAERTQILVVTIEPAGGATASDPAVDVLFYNFYLAANPNAQILEEDLLLPEGDFLFALIDRTTFDPTAKPGEYSCQGWWDWCPMVVEDGRITSVKVPENDPFLAGEGWDLGEGDPLQLIAAAARATGVDVIGIPAPAEPAE